MESFITSGNVYQFYDLPRLNIFAIKMYDVVVVPYTDPEFKSFEREVEAEWEKRHQLTIDTEALSAVYDLIKEQLKYFYAGDDNTVIYPKLRNMTDYEKYTEIEDNEAQSYSKVRKELLGLRHRDPEDVPCQLYYIAALKNNKLFGGTFVFYNPKFPQYIVMQGITKYIDATIFDISNPGNKEPKLNSLIQPVVVDLAKELRVKRIYVKPYGRKQAKILETYYGFQKTDSFEYPCGFELQNFSQSYVKNI